MAHMVYAHEYWNGTQSSIFLAGPSPRNKKHLNWRPEAIGWIQKFGFKGIVFIPLPRNGVWKPDYDPQVEWEIQHLELARVIAFWIPRDKTKLPGFTTNVEFGEYLKSKKIVLGYPPEATK